MGTTRKLRRNTLVATVGLMLLGPAAVALAASGTFTGTTTQGHKCGNTFKKRCAVQVEIAGRTVGKPHTGKSHVLWRARCKSGSFLTGDTAFWGTMDSNNNLTVHGHYTESGLGNGPHGPITARNTVTVSIHAASKVTGTVTDSSAVHEGSKVIDHCHTGTVSFTARR